MLKIAQKFAGYSLGAADIMRKAMGKKIAYVMQAEHERFVKGAIELGYSEADAEKVFGLIEPFAGYVQQGALLRLRHAELPDAWLKANYPHEYLTAILMGAESHPGHAGPRPQTYNECVRIGIKVLLAGRQQERRQLPARDQEDAQHRHPLRSVGNQERRGRCRVADSDSTEQGGASTSIDDLPQPGRATSTSAPWRAWRRPARWTASRRPRCTRLLLVNLDRPLNLAQSAQKRESGQTTMFDLRAEVATPLTGIDLESAPVPRQEMGLGEGAAGRLSGNLTHAAPDLAPHVTAVCSELTQEALGELPREGRDFVIAGIVNSTRAYDAHRRGSSPRSCRT